MRNFGALAVTVTSLMLASAFAVNVVIINDESGLPDNIVPIKLNGGNPILIDSAYYRVFLTRIVMVIPVLMRQD